MNYEDIQKLINDMGDSKIDSLDIEFPDGIKIKMQKNTQPQISSTPVKMINELPLVDCSNTYKNQSKQVEEDCNVVKSPMVGTFYAGPSHLQPPFIKIGDKVKKGDVLCIVEAMKLMNEIESEFDGEIVEIYVENENMVEYGTPLFKIRR